MACRSWPCGRACGRGLARPEAIGDRRPPRPAIHDDRRPGCLSNCILTCCGMRAGISLPTMGTIPEPCSTISATRTSSTPSATPSFHRTGSAISGEISVKWRPSPAPQVGTGTVRRISNELGCACGRCDPPVGGTFHFENLIMPPLTKTCPKMVLSH